MSLLVGVEPVTLLRLLPGIAGEVDSFIYSFVRGEPARLYEAALHLVRAGGKRLRPAVVVLSARVAGGREAGARAVPLGAAVELFHTFTLIHDDIMDRDDFRRGVETVHRRYGLDMAILAGDLLHVEAFRAIAESGLPAEAVARASRALSLAGKRVSEGQALDMMFEETWDVTVDDYLRMIYLKTGALIEASARMGAAAAGAPEGVEEALGTYGARVGVAFQIRDDVLGVYGDPAKTGKPVYNDLREGKKTILVLKALESLPPDEAEELRRIVGARGRGVGEEDYRLAAELIRRSGALDYAMELARRLAREAIEALESVEARDEEALRALRELAVFAVEREK